MAYISFKKQFPQWKNKEERKEEGERSGGGRRKEQGEGEREEGEGQSKERMKRGKKEGREKGNLYALVKAIQGIRKNRNSHKFAWKMMTEKLKLLHTYSSSKHVNRETKINVPHRKYVYTYLFVNIRVDSPEHTFI